MKTFYALTILLITFACNPISAQPDTTTRKSNSFEQFYEPGKIEWFSDDTITKKGKRYRVTNFSYQIHGGGIKYFYDDNTKKYFGNYLTDVFGIYLYYKNFFYGVTSTEQTLNLTDSLHIVGSTTLDKNTPVKIINMTITIGYELRDRSGLSVVPYFGMLISGLSSETVSGFNKIGMTLGLSLNEYIKIGKINYLIVYASGSTNLSRYNNFSTSLGDSFYTFEVGLGYRGWFRSKIK